MKVTGSDTPKHRKSPKDSCLKKVSAEQKEYAEACAPPRMTETDITNANEQTERLLEKILALENLNTAYKQVKRNKGAGGIDGMTVEQLLPYLKPIKKNFCNQSGTKHIVQSPFAEWKYPKRTVRSAKSQEEAMEWALKRGKQGLIKSFLAGSTISNWRT